MLELLHEGNVTERQLREGYAKALRAIRRLSIAISEDPLNESSDDEQKREFAEIRASLWSIRKRIDELYCVPLGDAAKQSVRNEVFRMRGA